MVVTSATRELVAGFMHVAAQAEAEPTEGLLHTLLDISSRLCEATGTATSSDTALLARELLEHAEGLSEQTNLQVPVEDSVARARSLVKEAQGYVRLSLFELAEEAVSSALLLLETDEDVITQDSGEWRDPVTSVVRLGDLRLSKLRELLDEVASTVVASHLTISTSDGDIVEVDALDGHLRPPLIINGDTWPEDDLIEGLIHAGDCMLYGHSVSREERDLEPGDPLHPADLLMTAEQNSAPAAAEPVALMFSELARSADRAWLCRTIRGRTRVVDVYPKSSATFAEIDDMTDAAQELLTTLECAIEEPRAILMNGHDGIWLTLVDGGCTAGLLFEGRPFSRIVSIVAKLAGG